MGSLHGSLGPCPHPPPPCRAPPVLDRLGLTAAVAHNLRDVLGFTPGTLVRKQGQLVDGWRGSQQHDREDGPHQDPKHCARHLRSPGTKHRWQVRCSIASEVRCSGAERYLPHMDSDPRSQSRISTCSPGWPPIKSVSKDDFVFLILLIPHTYCSCMDSSKYTSDLSKPQKQLYVVSHLPALGRLNGPQ